jgi:lipopolysaccharide/colanic/teichoic acid biosynthesis glycosyltransferase
MARYSYLTHYKIHAGATAGYPAVRKHLSWPVNCTGRVGCLSGRSSGAGVPGSQAEDSGLLRRSLSVTGAVTRKISKSGESNGGNCSMATGYIKPTSISDAGNQCRAAQPKAAARAVSSEEAFHTTLTLERRRAERCQKPFVLMLLDARHENGTATAILRGALAGLTSLVRETDALGWYRDGAILGVIFTEVGDHNKDLITGALKTKVENRLRQQLGPETAGKIVISFHVFPEHWDRNDSDWMANSTLYPEFKSRGAGKNISRAIKRGIDIAGSAALMILLLPAFVAIAAVIKLTSNGPVLFRQERMGRFGARFKFLKFRSMYLNNAPAIHQEYVREFIAGKQTAKQSDSEAPTVYKITNDPRVTPVGRFLRKTSLDELPQLWNVLIGEMSLVGPRPPVPYEYEVYEPWHRRRVLEVQPGITGLWQVKGRSRTTFDEMVRLDLHYAANWSLWLDLKILVATPKAVLSSSGAY